ncbi:DUF3078 domain-containing protein [Aquimarina sp. I32.4]|uniref:DUF3078 domain-containing protein n=1 Tax=Aquimarina sp. I32.4 TaxID=2053903 RepID=UPI000CDE6C0D|nr:DUF3078 domain-containing protein [Aquimarina sp. I32.4]
MKNIFLIATTFLVVAVLNAQDYEARYQASNESGNHYTNSKKSHDVEGKKSEGHEEGWALEGGINPMFGQATFNDKWVGGGTSDISGGVTILSVFNYKKEKLIFDNEILADYGIARDSRDGRIIHKTNDKLEVNSLLGLRIKELTSVYYSMFFNFKTQFDKGYKYKEDEFGDEYKIETSHILSPADIKVGPGMLWKKSEHFFLNISPAAGRLTIVDKDFTRVDLHDEEAMEHYEHHKYFGVEANKASLFEFGATLRFFSKFEIMKDLSVSNSIELYSNYLEAPQNVDVNYNMSLMMMIGKHLSTSFVFESIYDDDAIGGLQIREGFGLGVNYEF